jgi:hypothetical protein
MGIQQRKGVKKMEMLFQQFTQTTGSYIPRILGAVAIFIIGWLLALILSAALQNVLQRISLNSRLARWISAEEEKKPIELEKGIAKGLFYLIMLFVLVASFQALGITLITEPINNLLNQLFKFAPQLLGSLLLVVVAWIVAKIMKLIVAKGLGAARFDEKIGGKTGVDMEKLPMTKTLSELVFWLVLLIFFPAILSTLGLEGLLKPVQGMMNKFLDFMPNIFAAILIGLVGWLVARIVQRIVTSFFEAIGADRLSERLGIASTLGKQKLSGVMGLIVYVFIIIPIMVAALNALQLDAVTQPVSSMLGMILAALPNIFAAALILIVSYIIGRVVSTLVSNLLGGIGFNGILAQIGIGGEIAEGTWTPSGIAGSLVLIGIMLFAFIEAAEQLGFKMLSGIFSEFTTLAGHIVLGLIIFCIGLFLANFVHKTILSTTTMQARLLAASARIAVIVMAGAMALRQMGLANEIVNLAFGLLLGAIAVAVAIAFGIGGREIAARELASWVASIKANNQNNL